MRQVPVTNATSSEPQLAIVGLGRVGNHLSQYLQLKKISHLTYSRRSTPSLHLALQNCTHIALAIQDSDIESFILAHSELKPIAWIHFSGALSTPLAWGAHPLYSFGHTLYDLETYQKIPFILDQNSPPLSSLLPGLSNPSFCIAPEKKALYHAGCVLAGNFTTLLWQKFFHLLDESIEIPHSAAIPYLEQIALNLAQNPAAALTGPLARNDTETIEKNLTALGQDPFAGVYRAFVKAYGETR